MLDCISQLTVWKNEKFSLTEKKFRQINYLVISLVKPLLSRNFCQKSVRENFYTVQLTEYWKDEKFSLIEKILREINSLVASKKMVWRKIEHGSDLAKFPYCVAAMQCGKMRNFLSPKFLSWNQLFSKCFSKIPGCRIHVHEYLDRDQSWLTITEETMMKVTNI